MTVQTQLEKMRSDYMQCDREYLERVAAVHYGLDGADVAEMSDQELVDRMVEIEYHAACV